VPVLVHRAMLRLILSRGAELSEFSVAAVSSSM